MGELKVENLPFLGLHGKDRFSEISKTDQSVHAKVCQSIGVSVEQSCSLLEREVQLKSAPASMTVSVEENVVVADPLAEFLASESVSVSQILGFRVSQIDIMTLFIELMKLMIKNRQEEKLSRRLERDAQILHMEEVVKNYKEQGKWRMMSGIGGGFMKIFAGAIPIIDKAGGEMIFSKLQNYLSFLSETKQHEFFKSMAKMMDASADMYGQAGHIHDAFSESHRTKDQGLGELAKANWEEINRVLDAYREDWRGFEGFITEALRMRYQADTSLNR